MANLTLFLSHLRQFGKLIANGDGSYSEQVAVVNGASVLAVSPWPALPAPSYNVAGNAIAPAINTQIVATPAMAAGDYYIEIDVMSNDAAGAGNYLFVQQSGGKQATFVHTPFSAPIRWSRVAVAAGDIVEVRNGAAGGAGTRYAGAIRAYKLA